MILVFMVLVVLMNDSCCIRIVSCSYCFLHIIIYCFYDFVALAVLVDLTLTELADGFGLMGLVLLMVLMVLMGLVLLMVLVVLMVLAVLVVLMVLVVLVVLMVLVFTSDCAASILVGFPLPSALCCSSFFVCIKTVCPYRVSEWSEAEGLVWEQNASIARYIVVGPHCC